MKNATEPVYLCVSDIAEDFTNVTGNKQYGRAAAMAYAIYYRDTIIDTVRCGRGAIDQKTLELSRHIRCTYARKHNEKLSNNMLTAQFPLNRIITDV